MKKRFIVENVVSDYGVFDTKYGDGERLECICSARANADLIADILNIDYSKPNECTYYENELQQENTILKKALEFSVALLRENAGTMDIIRNFESIKDYTNLLENIDKAVVYFIEQAKESIENE